MSAQGITTELRIFIRSFIHSIEQLEVLLLLRGPPQRTWNIHEINETMRSDESSIRSRVHIMVQLGLLAEDPGQGTYWYNPADPEFERLIAELAVAYRERRTKVIEVIYARHRPELEAFSRAFVLKKDNGDHEH